jgi:hypothetical protein
LGKDPYFDFLDYVLEGFSSNNLTKVIMEALTRGEGMPKDQVVNKLMNFGTDDVNVFQGTSVTLNKFEMIMHLSP